jgi:Na+/proline symporter
MQITSFLLNLDVIIYVCIGLLLFLVTGIIIRDKPKNIKDYALGGKTFSVPVLVATMAATLIGGGSTIGEAALYYNKGLLFIGSTAFLVDGAKYIKTTQI